MTLDLPRVLAIDGNSVFHRAWHAYERAGLRSADGRPIFAVYGFMALLAGICDKTNPDALVVGFDSLRNDRKARWPEYKATRAAKPDGFADQFCATRDLLDRLGVLTVTPDGWEADDVLGSTAEAAERRGWDCVLATSDRDAFALISERTTVLRLASGLDSAVAFTPAELQERHGIRPDQYRSYAALRGDTSDNLPGVRGIGEKTAAKILAVTSVEAILSDPEAFGALVGAKVVAKILDGADFYRRNIEVMTIRRDLTVDLDAAWLDADPATTAAQLTGSLPSLAGRVAFALAGRRSRPSARAVAA